GRHAGAGPQRRRHPGGGPEGRGSEIGDALGPSPLTAKTHVSRITGKPGARDRAQLVVVAYESGMVTPGTMCTVRPREPR
ncbi:response regulator transcription factor, partial [Streptomyces griseoruber]|uniref:response regulator transcription factor n=1 Tax=Streptomyces griseoruber TaxID=1943 RepID=UPI003B8A8910